MARTYIFKRFERFWHWTQAGLILFMLVSGFEIHGTYHLLGWQKAAQYHTYAAWSLVGLWLFAIFWHFTTGEWRQYIPTLHNISIVVRYYSVGIFRGDAHPHRATQLTKHNPLQRIAYLFVKLAINPLIWITGLAYLYYNELGASGIPFLVRMDLESIALAHTAAAFLMLIFLVVHVYFATTGHTPLAHIKAMITGWEDVHGEAAPLATPNR